MGNQGSAQIEVCFAVLDEAGDVGFQARSSRYIVGAAIVTRSLHGLQRVAGAVRKEAGKRRVRLPELKARLVPPELLKEGLQRALAWDWQVIAAAVDKGARLSSPKDPEELYRRLTAHLVERCAECCAVLRVIIDKRYTNQRLRDSLVQAIETTLAGMPERITATLEQSDSQAHRELLLADYVAWAMFQKYERGNLEAYQIIGQRIVSEETSTWHAVLSPELDEKTVWRPGSRFSPSETD